MPSSVFPIDDASRVSEVRRRVIALAYRENLDETAASNIAIVATELTTNLLKHATGGEIHLSPLADRGQNGIEIVSIDRGPGIVNLRTCIDDGYSSAGTPGNGLGAVVRLSTSFDAYSQSGKGTVLVSRVQPQPAKPPPILRVAVAAVSKPVANEQVSGDAWAVKYTGRGALLLLADGLGHGTAAAEASGQAVSAFMQANDESPAAIVRLLHASLRGTRGAAVAIAHLDCEKLECKFSGIGNIAGRVMSPEITFNMVSHVGTAGFEARRFQEFTYRLPPGGRLVMHSDGLTSSWTINGYPGLLNYDPAVIAAVLYRDAARGRDDVCVLAAKWECLA